MNGLLLPVDKANHFIAGTIIYSVSALFFSPLISLLPVVIIGGLKETYDYYSGNGTPDVYDFLYTLIGSIPVLLIYFLNY
jgi:hypothetical protein